MSEKHTPEDAVVDEHINRVLEARVAELEGKLEKTQMDLASSISLTEDARRQSDRLTAQVAELEKEVNIQNNAALHWKRDHHKLRARVEELETAFERKHGQAISLQGQVAELEVEVKLFRETSQQFKVALHGETLLAKSLTAQVERLRGELSTAYMSVGTMMGKTEEPQSIRMIGEIAQESIQDALAETKGDK